MEKERDGVKKRGEGHGERRDTQTEDRGRETKRENMVNEQDTTACKPCCYLREHSLLFSFAEGANSKAKTVFAQISLLHVSCFMYFRA